MTTDTEATTHAATEEPRDLDTLLHLGTYQGMSDEEVQLCIDWYKERSYKDGYDAADKDLYKEMTERILADSKAAQEKAEAAFNTAVLSTLKLETVSNNG